MTEAHRYRYRIWCTDCTGEDPEGCFGGGDHVSEETFATESDAEDRGCKIARGVGPWRVEVISDLPEKEKVTAE